MRQDYKSVITSLTAQLKNYQKLNLHVFVTYVLRYLGMHFLSGVYILHKIYFFSPATNFFIFFPPLVFSLQVGGKMKKYLKNSIFYLFYPSYHTFFQFFLTKEGGEMEKMFSVFLIFTFFFPPTTYFLFPPPPWAGGPFSNIHPCT